MPVPPIIQRVFFHLADAINNRRTFPVPDSRRLHAGRIISHRGSHDNCRILENTLAAFDKVAAAGVWGIEMDIRWTRDLVPVVYHDLDLDRLYGRRESIASLKLDDLQTRYPAIPALSEIVSRYGQKCHLMIEVKRQSWPAPRVQEQRLLEILQPLEPIRDYHLLALDPAILQPFSKVPPQACVAIADGWPAFSSRWVRRHHWGGLCGHYLLVPKSLVQNHHLRHQLVGTGYIQSRGCLFRELNRGIDWIFSNDAVALQEILKAMISGK